MRILVAEADAPLAESLRQQLTREDFSVQVARNSEELQTFTTREVYDVVVLSLELSEHPGLDVLSRIKCKHPELPILVAAGASGVEDRVRALDAGADDYLVKPVACEELAARIRAVLRRNVSANAVLSVADLALDRLGHTVQRGGRALDLSPREFALLEFLMRNAGRPVTRAAIVEHVWKLNFEGTTNVVDVYINYLRRKVDKGHDKALIRTIRGVGYQIGANGTHP